MRNLHNWLVKQLVLSVLLLLSQEEVTQEEIENACRNANILEFIEGLPQYVVAFSAEEVLLEINIIFRGFDTEVGGKGSQLSGGQKCKGLHLLF